ncbi:MAG: tetratricopeptide repeat protein, partial [Clostridia bacterium]
MALKHIENMAYKQKDEDALLTLGRMYLNGVGVKVDTDKAFACFKKLAKKYNNKDAYYYVGYMLAYGVGRTVNKKGAVKNIVKASELGSPIADYALSVMYAGGKFGLHQDLQKAAELKEKDTTKDICFVLFDASIEIDKELSNLLVGDITKERQISQIIPKQQESLYLCKEAAEAGCPEAMLSFGIKLLFGDGIEKDFEKARQMIERCLPYNVGMAYYALGYIYDIGLGVQQNCWTAYSYYKKASSLGEKCADVNIAYCNLHGFGCKCNQKKGYEMLKELSKDDNPYANYYLGLCYLNGYGCKVDSAKARDYFNMASTAKIARAYYNLGLLSDAKKNNVGLDENSAAVQNLNKAYELGDMDGAAILSAIYSKSTSGDDLDKAKKLNEMSVGNRSAEGDLEKAKKWMSGEIYAKNFNEADKFYRMAAIAGN